MNNLHMHYDHLDLDRPVFIDYFGIQIDEYGKYYEYICTHIDFLLFYIKIQSQL